MITQTLKIKSVKSEDHGPAVSRSRIFLQPGLVSLLAALFKSPGLQLERVTKII